MMHKISGIGSLIRGGKRICGGCRVGLLSRRPAPIATRASPSPSAQAPLETPPPKKSWTAMIQPPKAEAAVEQIGKSVFSAYVSFGCVGYWLDQRRVEANAKTAETLIEIRDGVNSMINKLDEESETKKALLESLKKITNDQQKMLLLMSAALAK